MCGIAGYFSSSLPDHAHRKYFPEVVERVRHRGPDDTGTVYGSLSDSLLAAEDARVRWALGHTRLSILDLSSQGHQPMPDASNRVWLTYNGEVYNYLELRDELKQRGHVFHTATDTEVILASWQEWGEECVTHFTGMFAFILVDLRKQCVFIARDRLGIKPLYLWQHGKTTVLVSEPKQLLAIPEFSPRINRQIVVDFLIDGVLEHDPGECCYAQVHRFAPGHTLVWDLSGQPEVLRAKRYWDPERTTSAMSWGAATERFGEIFRSSIAWRLRSDVTVGSCLSGGLDSSSIVGVSSREQGVSLKTISSCWHNSPADEQEYIDAVNKHCASEAVKVFPSEDELLSDLDQLVYQQDEPFGSLSIFAQWRVMQTAKAAGVTVLLDGQGGDECLCGYMKYSHLYLRELLSRGRLLRATVHAANMGTRGDKRLFDWRLGQRYLPQPLRGLTPPPEVLLLAKWKKLSRHIWRQRMGQTRGLHEYQWADFTQWSLPALLRYEDRNSMAHGVEARVPFVDHRLVELCLRLPEEFFFRGGMTKRLLTTAMGDTLPELVRNRRSKLGFETPQDALLKGKVGQHLASRLSKNDRLGSLVDLAQLTDAFTAYREGRGTMTGAVLFRFLSVGLWLERMNVEM